MISIEQSNQQLRKAIRLQRQALTKQQLDIAERKISIQFNKLLPFHKSIQVASYLPYGGEISPAHIEKRLIHANFYLPHITHFHFGKMAFYSSKNRLLKNRYGIHEPQATGNPTQLSTLDLIFVPLVAFDRDGNRLGMGAGFYDRALAFKNNIKNQNRPLLVGLAHHFQEVKSLTPQSWDVALDVILTDRESINLS